MSDILSIANSNIFEALERCWGHSVRSAIKLDEVIGTETVLSVEDRKGLAVCLTIQKAKIRLPYWLFRGLFCRPELVFLGSSQAMISDKAKLVNPVPELAREFEKWERGGIPIAFRILKTRHQYNFQHAVIARTSPTLASQTFSVDTVHTLQSAPERG